MSKRGRQQVLPFERQRPERRRGVRLGRKPRPERIGFVAHVKRAAHEARHPVHVSIKRVPHAPSFRAQRVYTAIVQELAVLVARGIRVLHYSIQHDHVHLIVEAEDGPKLSRGMQLLFSRMAFAVNRVAMRTGRVFRDRHHRHELKTPTEVRRALVYVIFNTRKHQARSAAAASTSSIALELDACSSAIWFDEWDVRARPPPELVARERARAGPVPLSEPRTWLARVGWKRAGGAIRFDESPLLARR
jgi:putative transposase